MPEGSRPDDSNSGDADSKGGLWHSIRKFFDEGSDTSLRDQIKEAIDEHEEERSNGGVSSGSGDMSAIELTMLRNLLQFSGLDADDVAIPRSEIIAVPTSASWDELVAQFAEHGHSRLPIYLETLDDVQGMIHIKDIFPFLARNERPDDWTTLMRQPLYVPQARGALDVLADMRSRRTHLAIVVDEFSGTDGIITIEDLVEEIVGDIEDEHDDAPVDLIVLLDDGSWEVDARAELDDVAARVGDVRLAEVEESVDTLGGLAFVLAGHVPEPGTVLEHASGWQIEVTAGDATHVTRLRLHEPRSEIEIGDTDG